MGYRSNVAFAFTKENNDKLLEKHKDDQEFLDFLNSLLYHEQDIDKKVVYYDELLKWYGTYPDIKKIEEFFDELDSEKKVSEYGFLRLGEDFGDIEMRGEFEDFGINFIRKIEIDN